MKVTIIGDSNTAVSFYLNRWNEYVRTSNLTLITKLRETTNWEISPYTCTTVSKGDDFSYVNAIEDASPGDVCFFQGTSNDWGINRPLGKVDSIDTKTFYGALNFIAKIGTKKFRNVIFATAFKISNLKSFAMFNDAVNIVAENHHCTLIDYYNNEFFSKNENKRLLPDGEHMSEEGLSLYLQILIDVISDLT